jgi:hypothetical protein
MPINGRMLFYSMVERDELSKNENWLGGLPHRAKLIPIKILAF